VHPDRITPVHQKKPRFTHGHEQIARYLHSALSLAAQCIVIGPVCGFVCGFVCLCVGLLPR